jgi:hypothetical protein
VTSGLWGGANLVPVRWLQLCLRSSVRRFLRCSYWFWWRLQSFIWCLRQWYLQELVTAPPTVLSRFALTHPLHFPVAPRRLGGAIRSSLPYPSKHWRSMGSSGGTRMERERKDGDGGRRWETLCFACPRLFACLLVRAGVSMGICWFGVCRRDSC